MSASKVILILGAGGRVGASVASLFAENGYKVAIAARRFEDKVNNDGQLQIKSDLSKPDAVKSSFEKVTAKFGSPSVVIYNAAAAHMAPADSPLDISVEDFTEDLNLNIIGGFAAAKTAVEGFKKLPSGTKGTFIYTGNILNVNGSIIPFLWSNGVGKSAISHMINTASHSYASQGYRFYYADERKADGAAAFRDVSGPGHAKHYLDLAEGDGEQSWWQTFVTGEGYKDFSHKL